MIVLIPLLAWGLCVGLYWVRGFHLTVTRYSDSAAYVECANSIADGRGFVHTRGFHGLDPQLWEPINLWPPGYPLMMSPLVLLGVPAWYAGVAIATLSSAVALCLIGWFARRWLPFWPALAVTTAFAMSRPFVELSTACLSDSTYLALTGLSMYAMTRALHGSDDDTGRSAARWCFAAGIAAGAAWVMRNVGVALGLASIVAFASFFSMWPFKAVIRRGLLWSLGFMLAAGWLIARNAWVFGKFNPYSMRPSTRGLWLNTVDAFSTIAGDAAGLWEVHYEKAAIGVIVVVGMMLILAIISLGRGGANRADAIRRRFVVWFPAVYAGIYLAVVIGSRTVYQWGELVNSRHLVQITWLIWLGLAATVLWAARGLGKDRAIGSLIVCGLMVAVILQQGRLHAKTIARFAHDPSGPITETLARQIASMVGPDQIVLTDHHVPLRTYAGLFARQLPRPGDGDAAISEYGIDTRTKYGKMWGIVLADPWEARGGTYGPTIQRLAERPESWPGFERLPLKEGVLVLKWVGPMAKGINPRPSTPK
jgi:hypothetical protein